MRSCKMVKQYHANYFQNMVSIIKHYIGKLYMKSSFSSEKQLGWTCLHLHFVSFIQLNSKKNALAKIITEEEKFN